MTTKSGKVIGDGGEDTDDPEGRKRRKYSLEASRQSAVGDCCNTSPPEKVRVNQNISCSSSSVSQSSPISPSILQNVESARRTFLEAKPFPHGVVQGLCVDGFLEQVLDEVKQNSTVRFKESDLFRVYQSIDLGNLKNGSPLAAKLPKLMSLKRTLYSSSFRHFIEDITGLDRGTLTEQVDCAANCHLKGCHLLCHDDVIGTRKISFIVYLTDPTYAWRDEDGGRLELYASDVEDDCMVAKSSHNEQERNDASSPRKLLPRPFPSATILPIFNSMAYFIVKPGESFHSVQEVFADEPRLSIQGWYHAKNSPHDSHDATLARLKSAAKGEDTEGAFIVLSGLEKDDMVSCDESYLTDLTDGDRQYLSSFINNVYLKKESMDDIRQRFVKESSAKLRHFLNDRWMSLVSSAALHQDHGDGVGKGSPALQYDIGTSKEWKAVGPSHKQRFLEFVGVECDSHGQSAGGLMKHIRHRLFTSEPFKRFLAAITNLGKPVGYRSRVRRFRPGYDYTVAHYGVLTTKAVLDATLCFAAGEGKPCRNDEDTGGLIGSGDDAKWESGDFGGFECYIAADDENEDEPDDEYNADDDTELLSVSASNNTLSLVYRDPGTMRFVKYVGHGAPSSRWDLSIEYEMAEQEDNGPESDEESLIGDDE